MLSGDDSPFERPAESGGVSSDVTTAGDEQNLLAQQRHDDETYLFASRSRTDLPPGFVATPRDGTSSALSLSLSLSSDTPARPETASPFRPESINFSPPAQLQATLNGSVASSAKQTRPSRSPQPSALGEKSPLLHAYRSQDAGLMRHFTDTVALALDYGDDSWNFATVVPQSASRYEPLLKAILAVSARCLRVVGQPVEGDEMQYYWDSYRGLKRSQDADGTSMTDRYTTAVLLEFFHSVGCSVAGVTLPETQPSGVQGFLHAADYGVGLAGAAQAAIWTRLRFELYFAVIHQQSMPIDPDCFKQSAELLVQDDYDQYWTSKMAMHLGNIVRYCFDEDDESQLTYKQLFEAVHGWILNKPVSFEPLYAREQRGEATPGHSFPEIHVLSDTVALGLQLYYLARILLIAYDPAIPRLGLGSYVARRSIDVSPSSVLSCVLLRRYCSLPCVAHLTRRRRYFFTSLSETRLLV